MIVTQNSGLQPADKKAEITFVRGGYARGKRIPWQLKMGLKVALASLPFSYNILSGMGIFKHGDLGTNIEGLWKSFEDHFDFYRAQKDANPGTCLELGPGDSIGHALAAKAADVKEMWFVDVGDFATDDPEHYRKFYGRLAGSLTDKGRLENFSRAAVLDYCNAHYGTNGLASLKDVPAGVLDFSFSHAVLEHVARDEFAATMRELFRAHRPGSISRHWVDLHDHLGGALNSFRFSPRFWESKAVRKAGFYTNRLTMDEMIAMAEAAGFDVEIRKIMKWNELPTPRKAMHSMFDAKSVEELNICTFLMILRKGGA